MSKKDRAERLRQISSALKGYAEEVGTLLDKDDALAYLVGEVREALGDTRMTLDAMADDLLSDEQN